MRDVAPHPGLGPAREIQFAEEIATRDKLAEVLAGEGWP
jgi:hypothetical protein